MSSYELGYQSNRSTAGEKAALLLAGSRLAIQGVNKRVYRSAAFTGTSSTSAQALYDPSDGVTALTIPAGVVVDQVWIWVRTAASTSGTYCGVVVGSAYPVTTGVGQAQANVALQTLVNGITVPRLISIVPSTEGANSTFVGGAGTTVDSAVSLQGFTISGTDAIAGSLAGFAAYGVWLQVSDINAAVQTNLY